MLKDGQNAPEQDQPADLGTARPVPTYAMRGPIPSQMIRPLMVRAFEMPAGGEFTPHSHAWGQLAYASEGILVVRTDFGAWTVPPARAVWLPPDIEHAITSPTTGAAFRSVYVAKDWAGPLGARCRVLHVTPLLREIIRRTARLPTDYNQDGPDGRLMQVLLDQILAMEEEAPLHLPMPRDPRLKRLADLLLNDLGNAEPAAALASRVGASPRTLARRFVEETGLSLGEWRRRLKIVTAVERLSAGAPVTTVAFDLGYESPSAFIAMFRKAVGRTPTAFMTKDAA
ncbi:MAG: helix-turn-helix transcriptional regulator [Alphaproteobacteria bacterium]|nr:helix-turn-helix transcriptional regulator [Alphaproteobacteria bacterium]